MTGKPRGSSGDVAAPRDAWSFAAAFAVMFAFFAFAPFALYPVFLMEVLCFALFACAFNLLIGMSAWFRSATRSISAGGELLRRPCAKSLGLAA